MALRLRVKRPVFSTKLIGTFVAVAALLAQPFGALPLPVANAASPSDVWITSAMPNPSGDESKGEYIILDNKTDAAVNLNGWTLSDNTSNVNLSGSIAANSTYKLCKETDATSNALPCDGEWASMSLLNSDGETLTLREGVTVIDQVSYTSSSDGIAVTFTNHTQAPVVSSLNNEEFVTNNGSYKGVSVGFNASNFGNVSNVTVVVTRADGSTVTKLANAGVRDLISNQTSAVQLTAPFVIQEGTFTEASDTEYWQPAGASSWTAATRPTSVQIGVTDQNGTKTVTNTNFSEPNGWTYVSLLSPVVSVCNESSFDMFTNGSVNGQGGWMSTGNYDQSVVSNTYGYTGFGCKSLRISNSRTGGSFGDQTFSNSIANEAGEASAENNGKSGGDRKDQFEASWDFASATKTYQPNLAIAASPDRGDGARMSWVQMQDRDDGIAINFNDYQASTATGFVSTTVASGLDRTVPHNVKVAMKFVAGPANDVVEVYVDGVKVHTGTSWEDYFRDLENNPTRTVDSVLFRASGTPAAATEGNGWLIDNFQSASSNSEQQLVAPVNLSPADGSFTKDPSFKMTWDVVPGAAKYEYETLYDNGTKEYKDDSASNNYEVVNGKVIRSNNGAPNSTYEWRVRAVGPSGTKGPWSAYSTVTVDTVLPELAVSTPTNNQLVGSSLTVKSVASDGSGLGAYYVAVDGVGKKYVHQPANGTMQDAVLSTSGLSDGAHTVLVRVTDKAGNAREVSRTIIIDTTAPVITINVADGDKLNDIKTLTMTTVETNPKIYNIRVLDSNGNPVQVNGQNLGTYNANNTTNSQNYDFNTKSVADGDYRLQFSARDNAGNNTTVFRNVVVDNTAPAIPTMLTPQNNSSINTNDFYFDWSDVADAVRYEMQNSTNPTVNSDGSFQNVMWTGDYQQVQPTESRARSVGANGTWYWQVRSVDAVGNASAWTSPWKVTIDMQAPAAPVLSVASSNGNALVSGNSSNTYSIVASWNQPSGADAAKYIYKYWNAINGNPYNAANPYTVEMSGTSQAGVFNQGEGTHYLQVFAVDAAGNQSAGSNVFVINYDGTMPTATVTSPSEGQSLSTEDTDDKLVVGGSFTDNGQRNYLQVELVRAGNLVAVNTVHGSQFTGDNYTTEFDVSGQPNGEYSIFYTATDMAGNVAQRLERKFTLNNQGSPVNTNPVDDETTSGTPTTGTDTTVVSPLAVAAASAIQPAVLGTAFIAAVNNLAPADEATSEQNDSGEILGTSITEPKDSGEVAGATDKAGWSIGDMAWYWWVAGVLGLMGLWLLIAAASRRLRGAES